MTVTHTGSTKKYSESWENIFSGKKGAKTAAATKPTAKKKSARGKKAKR